MAMGAASARIPVTIAKRFMVENPFGAGPLGRFGVWEERSRSRRMRGREASKAALRAESCDADRMCWEIYSLQQLFFDRGMSESVEGIGQSLRGDFCHRQAVFDLVLGLDGWLQRR
jgi:hypothetical protein